MFKIITLIFIFLTFTGYSQVRELKLKLVELNQLDDKLTEIELSKPTKELLELPEIDSNRLTNILNYAMFKSIRKKHLDQFRESETLNKMAEICNNILSKTKYENKSSWDNLQKYLHRSFRGMNCDFSIIQATAFRIPVVKVRGRYYYDKSDIDTDLHLFKGKKKTLTKKEIEEGKTYEPKPLEPIDEISLAKIFRKKIYQNLKKRHIADGTFSRIGVHLKIDEKTINRKKVPNLKVVLIIGAKKLKDIRYSPKEK